MAVLGAAALAQPAPQTSAEQEQRRAQERERLLRSSQEKSPDVRGAPAPAADNARLPASESPCFPIHTLQLRPVAGEQAAVATQFDWALNAAAGPDASDAPTGRCLGAESIAIVIKRLQNAVIARGSSATAPGALSAAGVHTVPSAST